jgi:hypothetical protein
MAKKIRKNSFLWHYGPGSLIYVDGVSVMPLALDHWIEPPFPKNRPLVNDTNIINIVQNIINSNLTPNIFLISDPKDEDEKMKFDRKKNKVPVKMFPTYLECQYCHTVKKIHNFAKVNNPQRPFAYKCSNIDCRGKSKLKPVRWVKICEYGHIDDFPFFAVAHNFNKKVMDECNSISVKLKIYPGDASGASYKIVCEDHQDMSKIFSSAESTTSIFPQLKKCTGQYKEYLHYPSIHPRISDRSFFEKEYVKCDKEARVVLRGKGNVYYSRVINSITIPTKILDPIILGELKNPTSKDMKRIIKKFRRKPNKEDLDDLNDDYEDIFENYDTNAKEAYNLFLKLIEESADTIPNLRRLEFQTLENPEKYTQSTLFKAKQIQIKRSNLSQYFEKIILVHRLKETRVLLSYSRVNPFGRENKNEVFVSSVNQNIFPAVEGFGEGIFFKLNNDRLKSWANNDAIKDRLSGLVNLISEYTYRNDIFEDHKSVEIVLLHTLSHALINQVALNSGYNSASIRERLYFFKENGKSTAGILIYTSGSGSGSLGGLVEQGKLQNLKIIFEDLINTVSWCSHDPACIAPPIDPDEKIRIDFQTGVLAACHSCLLLGETSCELWNQILDRVTLVGSEVDEKLKGVGYF